MFRSAILVAFAVVVFPTVSLAQFSPAMVPPNPLYQHPAYRYQFSLGTTIQTSFGSTFGGVTFPFTPAPQFFSKNYGRPAMPVYPWTGGGVPRSGYLSGGSGYVPTSQRDFEKAQREARAWANPDAAKNMISEQWAYEKLGLTPKGTEAGKPAPDALIRALGAATEGDVASGDALNQVLAAVAIAEAKGGKGASAFLPPQVLDEIRFSGGSGDALNLLRQAGRLPFPAVFAAPELRDLRDALDRDFAAAAAPVLAGKPIDVQKLMKLELALKKTEEVAPPLIRELSFEEAIASRRFLNQFASALKALKSGPASSLVNPTWATEGSNVADLAKHMTKHKLKFAAAPSGSEPIYLSLHKALSAYLFVLTQPKK